MLKLRKVELVGFKSFCEKTQLTFGGTGLSCIIGPNGCGKSNIVDAISWVLGEQSHKSLRAERMADCIFNGTAKRPPLGLAEVTLTLVDSELAEAARFVLGDSELAISAETTVEITEIPDPAADGSELEEVTPIDGEDRQADGPRGKTKRARGGHKHAAPGRPGEVVVGRRLYRSGQSEYLINGRTARLRDIQDLFMGIGLGPDSYAIIEQGRIGQVLSSKPSDRRAIIEEAAGITKYKTKKRLAETKLESSKLNLSRVNDIFVEVEKQLASLKRQASKARRYAEVREQMRTLLRAVWPAKPANCNARPNGFPWSSPERRRKRASERNRSPQWKRSRSGWTAAFTSWRPNCGRTKTSSVRLPWNWIARKTASCSTSAAGKSSPSEGASWLRSASKRTRKWSDSDHE